MLSGGQFACFSMLRLAWLHFELRCCILLQSALVKHVYVMVFNENSWIVFGNLHIWKIDKSTGCYLQVVVIGSTSAVNTSETFLILLVINTIHLCKWIPLRCIWSILITLALTLSVVNSFSHFSVFVIG